MRELIQNVFNNVYFQLNGQEYSFKNKQVLKHLDGFIKIIPRGAYEEWLYEFTIFQFAHYDQMRTRFDRIYVNWIYGEKALQRWNERTEAQMYFATQFKIRKGIRQDKIVKLSSSSLDSAERNRFEEMSRQFIHCDDNALFVKDCEDCVKCPMFDTCLAHARKEDL